MERERGQTERQGTPWAALPTAQAPPARSQPRIDSPRLLQSDQFCIQRRARGNLLLLRKFPAEREVDPRGQSPGLQQFLSRPFPRCLPRRCWVPDLRGAGPALRVTQALLARWHFPEAPLGPDFDILIAGHSKGKGEGEAEG